MPQAIVLGGLVTDLTAYAPRFPLPGETLVAQGFEIGFGGKGANTAYMCVQLGLDTALLAKLGDDQLGENYLKYLKTVGMNTSHISVEKNCASSTANITVINSGENTIVYYPAAIDKLSVEDIERSEKLFPEAKVFASVLETQSCNVAKGLELAKKHGLVTYVNAAPIGHEPFPIDSLPLIDYLCLNDIEGSALVCKLQGIPLKALENEDIVRCLLLKGGNTIILTKGGEGAAFASKESLKIQHVPAGKVDKVLDTTGAGDAFNGAFIYHLVVNGHLTTEEKIRKACGIASLTVQRKGTQASFVPKSEVPQIYL